MDLPHAWSSSENGSEQFYLPGLLKMPQHGPEDETLRVPLPKKVLGSPKQGCQAAL